MRSWLVLFFEAVDETMYSGRLLAVEEWIRYARAQETASTSSLLGRRNGASCSTWTTCHGPHRRAIRH